MIEWLLIVWFAGAENWVVIGDAHKSKADCERAAQITTALATQLKTPRPVERFYCVIREAKQGA
jgi:hypothetical protein